MKTFLAVLAALTVHHIIRTPIRKGIIDAFDYLDGRDRDILWDAQRAKGQTSFGWSGGRWRKLQHRLGLTDYKWK